MYMFIENTFRRALYQINDKNDALKYTKEFFGSFTKEAQSWFYNYKRKHITLDELIKEVSNHYDEIKRLNLFYDQDENAACTIRFYHKNIRKFEEEFNIHIVGLQNEKISNEAKEKKSIVNTLVKIRHLIKISKYI